MCNCRRLRIYPTPCAAFSPSPASNTDYHYRHVLLFLLRKVYVLEGLHTARSREACALCADMLVPNPLPPQSPSSLLPPAAIAMRQPDQRGAALKKTILTQRWRCSELCVLSAQTRRGSRQHMLTRELGAPLAWLAAVAAAAL